MSESNTVDGGGGTVHYDDDGNLFHIIDDKDVVVVVVEEEVEKEEKEEEEEDDDDDNDDDGATMMKENIDQPTVTIVSDTNSNRLPPSSSSSSSPLSLSPRRRRSPSICVGFSEAITYASLHLIDYTASEIYDCWWGFDDLHEIRNDNKDTISFMNYIATEINAPDHHHHGYQQEEVNYCSRGLEGKTKIGKRTRKKTKKASIMAVLEEQYLQRQELGYDDLDLTSTTTVMIDPIIIAMSYRVYSSSSQNEANHRAMRYRTENEREEELEEELLFFGFDCIDSDTISVINSNSNVSTACLDSPTSVNKFISAATTLPQTQKKGTSYHYS